MCATLGRIILILSLAVAAVLGEGCEICGDSFEASHATSIAETHSCDDCLLDGHHDSYEHQHVHVKSSAIERGAPQSLSVAVIVCTVRHDPVYSFQQPLGSRSNPILYSALIFNNPVLRC
jgi:hypothetical protein